MACFSKCESSARDMVRPSVPANSFSDRGEAAGLGSFTADGGFPTGPGTGIVAFGWAGVVLASPSSARAVALRPALVLVEGSLLRESFRVGVLIFFGIAIPPQEIDS